MNVKIDTKEKFTVITPTDTTFSANMTDNIQTYLEAYLTKDIPHVVLNMKHVEDIDEISGKTLASIQQLFYDKSCSFVICEMQKNVEEKLDELELLEVMNTTPTESEAWDIVQMEEIERELLDDENW